MTKPSEMPGWPDKAWYEEYFSAGMEHYERARADAWEARCRMAVGALRRISNLDDDHYSAAIRPADRALSTIGDLPPLPPQQRTEK